MSTPVDSHSYALVMAGGAGTRLWPMSRAALPKQFQYLLGSETPFQHMLKLITQVIPLDQVFVMAVPEFRSMILEQVPGFKEENILMEPARRDTGPAITLGMLQIEHRDPEAHVAIMWSDHRIERPEAFKTALEAAFQSIVERPDYVSVIGAKPTRPDTGLGYIQMSDEIAAYNGIRVFTAARFIEKPDAETAKRFVSSWEYLWNVGYSVTTTQTFFYNLNEVQPDLQNLVINLRELIKNPSVTTEDIATAYEALPKISIDYLYTQKLTKLIAVPADMGWSDIGSWTILHDVLASGQPNGLVTQGPVEVLETSQSLIYAKDRPIAVVGLKNIVVVDTGDAILVMDRNASSSLVKDLTNTLSTTNPELL
jgi:mannose-1-phosphate guanylyltransferase